MVGHLLEYHPAVDKIKQLIDSGELGDIYYMYCQRLSLGVVRQHENACWSLAPHDISVILYLFGMEPDGIAARGECFLQTNIDDVVFINLHFPDGRMAQVHVSWLDPHKERKMVVVGSQKMLVFDDMQPAEKVRIFDKLQCWTPPPPTPCKRSPSATATFISRTSVVPSRWTPRRSTSSTASSTTRSRVATAAMGCALVRVLEQVEHQLHQAPSIHQLPAREKRVA